MNPSKTYPTCQTMNSNQPSYERPRVVNIELGPRGSRPTERPETLPRTASTADTPRRVPDVPQFFLKYGKSSTVRWILNLIALLCTFGVGIGVGGYVGWKQGSCEQNLPAVMNNNTLTVGHRPTVGGGGKMSTHVGLAWIWLLAVYFLGTVFVF
ncbi:hypothetical protein BKA64DRAFT_650155 [Cadophora sp. MPI-SDFR-AT-0126]|nr:hypothetical protein BKA64DRAFT_650155 [Leotiomycetes sp. MPI-SDFR-AT-0126]